MSFPVQSPKTKPNTFDYFFFARFLTRARECSLTRVFPSLLVQIYAHSRARACKILQACTCLDKLSILPVCEKTQKSIPVQRYFCVLNCVQQASCEDCRNCPAPVHLICMRFQECSKLGFDMSNIGVNGI